MSDFIYRVRPKTMRLPPFYRDAFKTFLICGTLLPWFGFRLCLFRLFSGRECISCFCGRIHFNIYFIEEIHLPRYLTDAFFTGRTEELFCQVIDLSLKLSRSCWSTAFSFWVSSKVFRNSLRSSLSSLS